MGFGFGPGTEMQRVIKQNARPKRKPYSNFERSKGSGTPRKIDQPLSEARKLEIKLRLQKQRSTRHIKTGATLFGLIIAAFGWYLSM